MSRNLTIDLRFGKREIHINRTSRVLAPLISGLLILFAATISIPVMLLSAIVQTVNLLGHPRRR